MDSSYFGQQRIYILEGPGYKCQKTFGPFGLSVLYFAYPGEMFKTFLYCFYMTEHHGCRSSDIELMSFVHNIQPFLSTTFSFGYQASHAINQNFSASSGQAIQSGL